MQFPIETTQIVGIALALGIFLSVIAVWITAVWRRLEQNRRLVEEHWRTVRSRLKARGDLLPQLARVTQHRLASQRESMEVLARLRTRSIAGRNPPEKAAAEAELEAVLARVLAAASADPGLAGVSEFETARTALDESSAQIRHAVAVYNAAVETYNKRSSRFPASMLSRRTGSGNVALFDDGDGTFTESRTFV